MQKAAACWLTDLCIIVLGRQNDFWRHVHWSANHSFGWRAGIMLHASTLLLKSQQHVSMQQGLQAQAPGVQLYSTCIAGHIMLAWRCDCIQRRGSVFKVEPELSSGSRTEPDVEQFYF